MGVRFPPDRPHLIEIIMKHLNLLKAWTEGKPVQVDADNDGWVDIPSHENVNVTPLFSDSYNYRIKPEIVLTKPYRRYVKMQDGAPVVVICRINSTYLTDVRHIEDCVNFIKWIDLEPVTHTIEV